MVYWGKNENFRGLPTPLTQVYFSPVSIWIEAFPDIAIGFITTVDEILRITESMYRKTENVVSGCIKILGILF